jgi:hypothetical protein
MSMPMTVVVVILVVKVALGTHFIIIQSYMRLILYCQRKIEERHLFWYYYVYMYAVQTCT